MPYAWIIDEDHTTRHPSATGTYGPKDAPSELLTWLRPVRLSQLPTGSWCPPPPVEVFRFALYDNAGQRHLVGRIATDEGPTRAACRAPLDHDATLAYGITEIRYHADPYMDHRR